MFSRKLTLLGLGTLSVVVAVFLFARYRSSDRTGVDSQILEFVQAYDDAIYLHSDYDAAKDAANGIVNFAEQSDDPDATEVRGLVRLAFLEIWFGKWGNHWREKVDRCDALVSKEPTIDRGEYLYYTGAIMGKWQRKHDKGLTRLQEALWVSKHTEDDRTLALTYMTLGELNTFLDQRNLVAGKEYRAVTIAKYHGQKSIEFKTLKTLAIKLIHLDKYSEAGICGKEILKIDPKSPTGMYTEFLNNESESYVRFVENTYEKVNKLETEGIATPKQYANLGKHLTRLARCYAIKHKHALSRKYAELAIPYLERVDNQTALKLSLEILNLSKLEEADSVAKVNKIAWKFSREADEFALNSLAAAYAKVGASETSDHWRQRATNLSVKRKLDEIDFLKESSDAYWDAELVARKQIEISDALTAKSQDKVQLLTVAVVSGLSAFLLLSCFYLLLRRQRNSLENLVKTRTQSLSKATEAANSADQAKSQFLAQINHEIRNPLTAILGYCDLLSLNKEKSSEYVAGIESSSLHLRELVDKILEVSKIESGGLELKSAEFVPARTASDINDIVAEQAAKKGLQFTCSFRGNQTSTIISDETKIRQIALNLIGNAIKFTERGNVSVSFELDQSDSSLTMTVKDTGIGIAKHETPVVFERFSKASNSVACDGSGLGLFIIDQLVKCLAGEITLDSKLGVGTEVTVRLPVKFTHNSVSNQESVFVDDTSVLQNLSDEPSKRIILVDDQEIIRTSLKLLLNAHGIECETTQSLEETLELIKTWQPDLVLLDLQMPEQSGFEVFDRVRQSFSSEVLVYAMTGDATVEVQKKCLSLGFDGFITKPFEIKTVQEILDSQPSVKLHE